MKKQSNLSIILYFLYTLGILMGGKWGNNRYSESQNLMSGRHIHVQKVFLRTPRGLNTEVRFETEIGDFFKDNKVNQARPCTNSSFP